jgi:hypothetical protein
MYHHVVTQLNTRFHLLSRSAWCERDVQLLLQRVVWQTHSRCVGETLDLVVQVETLDHSH